MNVAKKLKRFENKKANGSSENNPDEPKSSDESEESDDYGDERILDDYFDKQSMSLSSREYENNSGDYFLSASNETIPCCNCHCHSMLKNGTGKFTNATSSSQKFSSEHSQQSSLTSELTKQPQSSNHHYHQENNQQILKNNNKLHRQDLSNLCDTSTQTLSTGDIVITKIYFNDSNQSGQE